MIPVIDLLDGDVVHAVRGQRGSYRPIRSPLAATAEPLAIADGLLRLAPFRRLYVADLDAIAGRPGHDATIEAIARAFPALEIWVDRGATKARASTEASIIPVIGTESFETAADLQDALDGGESVLSLDHDASGPIGPAEIHGDPGAWPRRVVVMTLARVGAGEGPDLARLRAVKAVAGDREIFAAGGVRDLSDLTALDKAGIAGALVATSLHDGRLSPVDLARALASPPRTPLRP